MRLLSISLAILISFTVQFASASTNNNWIVVTRLSNASPTVSVKVADTVAKPSSKPISQKQKITASKGIQRNLQVGKVDALTSAGSQPIKKPLPLRIFVF